MATLRNICGNCGNETGTLDLVDLKRTKATNQLEKEEDRRSYSCFQNTRNYFIEYCTGGTIHGVRYIGENRTFLEKLWWAASIVVSLYFCVQLIISTYIKWDTSPVIVSFATKETPAWMIPFPAVTICPEIKVRPSVFNYTKYYRMKTKNVQLDPEIEKKLGYLSYICDNHSDLNYTSEKFTDEDIIDFYDQVQPKFFEDASDCKYLGVPYNCSELFFPIITDVGICYTFNLVDRTQLLSNKVVHYKNYHTAPITDDWTLEHGYSKKAGVNAYPRRTLFSGVPYALEVKLTIYEEDLDYSCGDLLKGFQVQVTHPQRMPRVKEQHFIVPLDRASKAAVAPDMMTTSEAVQKYNPQRRNCHLPSERALKYFKVYAQNNCQVECRTNYTFSKCGCVEFYMSRDKDMPICGGGSVQCVKEARHDLLYGVIDRKIKAYNGEITKGNDDKLNCKCLPICTSMYYNVEYSQTPWNWRDIYKTKENQQKMSAINKTKHVSMLQVFFKGNQFLTSERNELYGSTDFLANVGGLLGLFIGFSALSFVEIIYYLTLRIICNVAMFGRRNWSGTTTN